VRRASVVVARLDWASAPVFYDPNVHFRYFERIFHFSRITWEGCNVPQPIQRTGPYLLLDEYELTFLTMMVDVYQTNKKGTYLFLPSGEPFSSVSQPVLDTVGLLQFLNTVELAAEMLGAKHSEIQADLEKQGYAIHEAKFKITEHE